MNIYHRYLSKYCIFLTSLFIFFLLTLESNIGFKFIFNITNYFFIGLKTEEIHGNWRNFTLKNINYKIDNFYIKAKSINFIINIHSIFHIYHVFKEINIKNLVILVKKNENFLPKNIIKNNNNIQKNVFFKHNFCIDSIKINSFILKIQEDQISFSNISSGLIWNKGNIVVLPTYINKINIFLKQLKLIDIIKHKKKNILLDDFHIDYFTKIFHSFSQYIHFFLSLRTDINFLQCKDLNYIHSGSTAHISNIELRAFLKKNLIQIKKIKAVFPLFHIESSGQYVVNNDLSIAFKIKNQILIPSFNKKIITFSINGIINDKLFIELKYNNILKFNISNIVLKYNNNSLSEIKINSEKICLFLNQDRLIEIDHLCFSLNHHQNYYFFSLNNIIQINRILSFYINIEGEFNLKKILIKKIDITPITTDVFKKKLQNISQKMTSKNLFLYLKNNIYTSTFMGDINILGNNINGYNLFIPNINLKGKFLDKKIFLLGSLYCKNFNYFQTSGISFVAGKNQLYLKGLLSNILRLHADININNLDYFFPGVKGIIMGQANTFGIFSSPHLNLHLIGKKLIWNNIFLKSIKISSNIQKKNELLGYITLNIKHFFCSFFNIDSLKINVDLNKKNISFLLNNKNLSIHIKVNSFQDKTKNHVFFMFKKIKIHTIFGNFIKRKIPLICFINNENISYFKKNNEIIKKNIFSSFKDIIKKNIFSPYKKNFFSIKCNVFFKTEFQWKLRNFLYKGNFFLISKNITLLNENKNKKYIINIDLLKLYSFFHNEYYEINFSMKYKDYLNESGFLSGHFSFYKKNNKQKLFGICNIFHLPYSFLKYFLSDDIEIQNGYITSQIKLNGNLWHPKISIDANIYNIIIKSHNLFKYISLCLNPIFKKIENIKIDQLINIKEGNIFFTTYYNFYNKNNEWTCNFNSNNMNISIFPHISLDFFSHLKLHYLLSRYNLKGKINFSLFSFNIDEKNIVFN